jgi:F-type H+-transporting ATPase subunit delta
VIETSLAKRYAKALVEIGVEKDAVEKYGRDLSELATMMETSRDFFELLVNPVFPREDKKRVAGLILDKLGTDPVVRNFVNLLIDRKRIDQLVGIEKAFRSQVDDLRGITRGEVTSAIPLDADELNRITMALSRSTGKKVILTPKVDPSLIGGLFAKVGDTVLDGTIRTQLNQLKESLKG